MFGVEKVLEIISETTKKKLNLKTPGDAGKLDIETLLKVELVVQLQELNTNLSAIHDELWDANQRRGDL